MQKYSNANKRVENVFSQGFFQANCFRASIPNKKQCIFNKSSRTLACGLIHTQMTCMGRLYHVLKPCTYFAARSRGVACDRAKEHFSISILYVFRKASRALDRVAWRVRSRGVVCDRVGSREIVLDLRSRAITLDRVRSRWIACDHVGSRAIALDRVRSRWIALDRVRSRWIALDRVASRRIAWRHVASRAIAPKTIFHYKVIYVIR